MSVRVHVFPPHDVNIPDKDQVRQEKSTPLDDFLLGSYNDKSLIFNDLRVFFRDFNYFWKRTGLGLGRDFSSKIEQADQYSVL